MSKKCVIIIARKKYKLWQLKMTRGIWKNIKIPKGFVEIFLFIIEILKIILILILHKHYAA